MQRRVSELKRTASMESRRTNSSSSSRSSSSGAPSPSPRPDGEDDAAAVFAPKRSLARSPGVRRRRCCHYSAAATLLACVLNLNQNWSVWVRARSPRSLGSRCWWWWINVVGPGNIGQPETPTAHTGI
eukprot:COSAG05_NODE_3980_length_1741_cov_1.498173_3_plen_127_part_01